MNAWLKMLFVPVVVGAAVTLLSPSRAQAQVYGYYSAPGFGMSYGYPAPYAYYGSPYGYSPYGYPPPYYGGYYPRPAIGFSFGVPFGGYGYGYRPYYHYGHYGRRW